MTLAIQQIARPPDEFVYIAHFVWYLRDLAAYVVLSSPYTESESDVHRLMP
jgi:hypothetical protein